VCIQKNIWSATTSWLDNHNIQVDKLDEITILFGCFNNNPDSNLLNHIIILGKYTIYICRNKNIKPSLSLLKAKTIQIRKLALFIAKKAAKESKLFITESGRKCYCKMLLLTCSLKLSSREIYTELIN